MGGRMKIHVIEPLAVSEDKMNEMRQQLRAAGHEIQFFGDRNPEPEESIRRSKGADIVVIGNLPFPAEVIKELPKLKMLAVAFTGLDHVAMDACREKNITVCNASGYSTINVAELTIGMMIDLSRNISRLDPLTRKGGTKDGMIGFDMAGKTVGLIGLGAIGQYVAKLLKGFDCHVLGLDRGKPLPEELGIKLVDSETLLKESDFVSLHCPLNDSTRGLIGKKEFALMKNSAYLINCSRGPVVDDAAMIDALKSSKIAGAALDVFAIEPPLNSKSVPVLELDNVIVTPHIAFATKEAFVRRADIVVDNILSWAAGNPKNVRS